MNNNAPFNPLRTQMLYEFIELAQSSNEEIWPTHYNPDKAWARAAYTADRIFEKKRTYPVFDFRSALNAFVEESEQNAKEESLDIHEGSSSITENPPIEESEKKATTSQVSNRIKSLQSNIKLPMAGGMPKRNVTMLSSFPKPSSESAGETSQAVSNLNAVGESKSHKLEHLTKTRSGGDKNRRPPSSRRLNINH